MSENRPYYADEAEAWLRGERSHLSTMMDVETSVENRTQTLADCERADAATTERAYWSLRAHREGLLALLAPDMSDETNPCGCPCHAGVFEHTPPYPCMCEKGDTRPEPPTRGQP